MKKTKRIPLLLCIASAAVIICSSVFAFNEYWNGNGISTHAADKRILVDVNNRAGWNSLRQDKKIALCINDRTAFNTIDISSSIKKIALCINDRTAWNTIDISSKIRKIAVSINDRSTWNSTFPSPDKRIAVAINNKSLWDGGFGTEPDLRIAIAINGSVDVEELKGTIAIALTEALADVPEKSNSNQTNQKTNTQLWDDLFK